MRLIWSVDGPPDRTDVNRGLFQPFAVVGAGPLIASPEGGADWRLRVQANFLFPR
jgi:hypothetical protein